MPHAWEPTIGHKQGPAWASGARSLFTLPSNTFHLSLVCPQGLWGIKGLNFELPWMKKKEKK